MSTRIEVRNSEGDLLRTVPETAAENIVKQLLGEWHSFGRRRYVRLAANAGSISCGWHGGNKTTRRAMGEWGQYIGAPKTTQEHRP